MQPATRIVQPEPIDVEILKINDATLIHRVWTQGDVANCRLCEECMARGNSCVIEADGPISDDQSWLYRKVTPRPVLTVFSSESCAQA